MIVVDCVNGDGVRRSAMHRYMYMYVIVISGIG